MEKEIRMDNSNLFFGEHHRLWRKQNRYILFIKRKLIVLIFYWNPGLISFSLSKYDFWSPKLLAYINHMEINIIYYLFYWINYKMYFLVSSQYKMWVSQRQMGILQRHSLRQVMWFRTSMDDYYLCTWRDFHNLRGMLR